MIIISPYLLIHWLRLKVYMCMHVRAHDCVFGVCLSACVRVSRFLHTHMRAFVCACEWAHIPVRALFES